MFSIYLLDSSKLFQWDLNRKIKIIGKEDVDEVHFSHVGDEEALVVKPIKENNILIANIPNILLQESKDIFVYLVYKDKTLKETFFTVGRREKPTDYLYTEIDILNYSSLEKRLAELEEKLNNISVEETDPTVPDWAKQPNKPRYTAAEVGALPSTETVQQLAQKQDKSNLVTSINASSADSTYPSTRAVYEYVGEEFARLIGSAPDALNTIEELANAFSNNQDVLDALNASIINKQDKADSVGIKTTQGGEIFNNYNSNTANALYAHAEGSGAKANGASAHAEGIDTEANQEAAHAEGRWTSATSKAAHSEGFDSVAGGTPVTKGSSPIEDYELGSAAHAEGIGTFAKGTAAHAEGYKTQAIGNAAHAEGESTKAEGNYAHAEGGGSWAYRDYTHAEGCNDGNQPTTASCLGAHAEGMGTISSGNGSHSEGKGSQALREASHAEGRYTKVEGDCGHAEGENSTVADGALCGHAEGYDCHANGKYTHAEGQKSTAHGNASHVEGYGNTTSSSAVCAHVEGDENLASAYASHVEGKGNLASGDYQHVQGKFNVEDTENKYAHIVGNGEDANNRSNAHTIDWNGTAEFANDVIANGCGGANPISLVQLSADVSALKPQIQSDWNQNNEAQSDYIKNKPFYHSPSSPFIEYGSENAIESIGEVNIPILIQDLSKTNQNTITNIINPNVLEDTWEKGETGFTGYNFVGKVEMYWRKYGVRISTSLLSGDSLKNNYTLLFIDDYNFEYIFNTNFKFTFITKLSTLDEANKILYPIVGVYITGLDTDEDGVIVTYVSAGVAYTNTLNEVFLKSNIARKPWVEKELINKINSPLTASIGQILEVEEVDENGKPTKWKTVDKPEVVTTTTDDKGKVVTVDSEGNKILEYPSIISYKYADKIQESNTGVLFCFDTAKPNLGLFSMPNKITTFRVYKDGVYIQDADLKTYNPFIELNVIDCNETRIFVIGKLSSGKVVSYFYYFSSNKWSVETQMLPLESLENIFIQAPDKAEVGQILSVKAVDENGYPNGFSVIDQATGVEITDGEPTKESTVLTVNPNAEEVNLCTEEDFNILKEEIKVERIEKSNDDTVVEIEPNKLYVFPEMTELSYTLSSKDKSKLEEYRFIFQSGATPTEITHPEGVKIGDFNVEANKIYEVSILEGLLLSQSWAVE